ncbi:MAG: hypothetical protein CV089_14185 [Nitrospira sp. WS110]|nr:hypothetical protein [Nitrospira sp. WS110]
MKKIGLSIVGSMVIFMGAVWLVDSAQTVEFYYETYQKLKETEHMSRGWVSRIIPASSYAIHTVQWLNGELVSVRFKYEPGDAKEDEPSCTVLEGDDPQLTRYRCQLSGHSVVVQLEPNGEGQIVSNK